MVHVDDLVLSMVFIANNSTTDGEIYIVTDGINYSSREIYDTMRLISGKDIPKWSLPKKIFQILSLLNSNIEYKVNKLLGSECYSSNKLRKLGFQTNKTLSDFNETDF